MATIRGNDNGQQLTGTAGNDFLFGYGGADVLISSTGDDSAYGGTGDDSVFGNDGNDFLSGDGGLDDVFGGAGSDTLSGGRGAEADFLYGGEARDTLYGGEGFDFLNGGSGNDLIIGIGRLNGFTSAVGYTFGLSGVTVNLASGFAIDEFGDRDTLIGILDVDGTDRADTIIGSAGDNFFTPFAGADSINGGAGIDEVNYNTGGTQGITVNLLSGSATDNFGNADRLANIENIRGTDFDDRIVGSTGDNTFRGLAGDDVIDGGAGFDEVWYDRDMDFGGFQGAEIDLAGGIAFDASGALDSLVRIEGAKGSRLGDTITGSSAANRLDGFFGDDTIFGGNGDDTLIGGEGRDRLTGGTGFDWVSYAGDRADGGGQGVNVDLATSRATDGFGTTDILSGIENAEASDGDDTMRGSTGANQLSGLDGDDTIRGGGGVDTITGGNGDDRLAGQGAVDVFVFGRDHGTDTIEDFFATGTEKIDFSGSSVDSFAELTVTQSGATTRIVSFEGTIILLNVQSTDITAADFLF